MFSELVGLPAMAAGIDPEDLRDVVSAYHTCVAEVVQRFGGFVAAYMGDGVLVYLGHPEAHEDDAERAIRAGLDMVAAVRGLKTIAALQTRVGIATGLVVVGDLFGSDASREQSIVGETPNIAARLRSIAEPNTVVIAESTRKLVGNLFELEYLGALNLKGAAAPVQAWAVLRPSLVESRFDALHATGLTELVGRVEELELLLRRWSKAESGDKWCFSRVKPGSASPGRRSLCSNAWPRCRTRACVISARSNIRTARSSPSSRRWSVRRDLQTTPPRVRSSTSSTPC
jgi:class 3 adenylate cyclase